MVTDSFPKESIYDIFESIGVFGEVTNKDVAGSILNEIRAMFKNNNYYVPTIDNFLYTDIESERNIRDAVRRYYVNLYLSCMKGLKIDCIPENVMAIQGALFGMSMFGYDVATTAKAIYTMNVDVLNKYCLLNKDDSFYYKKAYKANLEGKYQCIRLIIKNDPNSQPEAETVLIDYADPRTKVDNVSVLLVPYLFVDYMVQYLSSILNHVKVAEISQQVGATIKSRYCTLDTNILSKYSDMPVEGTVSCVSIPERGVCYLPVLGASSNSAMMTKVSAFDLLKITQLKESDLEGKVEKAMPATEGIVYRNIITKYILRQVYEEKKPLETILAMLPRSSELISTDDKFEVNDIRMYLNSISNSEMKQILGNIAMSDMLTKRYMGILNDYKQVKLTPDLLENFYTYLNSHLCQVVCYSNGRYSSRTLTNNKQILACFYGKDYITRYETLANRVRFAVQDSLEVGNLYEKLLDYKVELPESVAGGIMNLTESFLNSFTADDKRHYLYHSDDPDSLLNSILHEVIYGEKPFRAKREKSKTICGRGIDGYIVPDKIKGGYEVKDFYEFLNPDSIIKITNLATA